MNDEQITFLYTDNVPNMFPECQAFFHKKLYLKIFFSFETNG